jgi:ABC-type tungstate transport system substrate-binding protein
MISDLLSMTVLVGILASGIRLATPYLYAALGEALGQRSGVLNLGVEGQMLLGSFAAFYVVLITGNLWLGVLAAIIAAFGGIISEVGAVMLVGGNIEGQTRVLTTAIVLETRRGNFALALALGIILLMLAFAANYLFHRLSDE